MLLQQKTDAKIWGKANPGQKIKVTASWNAEAKTISGEDGKWSVKLDHSRSRRSIHNKNISQGYNNHDK